MLNQTNEIENKENRNNKWLFIILIISITIILLTAFILLKKKDIEKVVGINITEETQIQVLTSPLINNETIYCIMVEDNFTINCYDKENKFWMYNVTKYMGWYFG